MDIYMYVWCTRATEEGAKGRLRQVRRPSRTELLLFRHARAHRPAVKQFVFHHSALWPSGYERLLIGTALVGYNQRLPAMWGLSHSHVPCSGNPMRGTGRPSGVLQSRNACLSQIGLLARASGHATRGHTLRSPLPETQSQPPALLCGGWACSGRLGLGRPQAARVARTVASLGDPEATHPRKPSPGSLRMYVQLRQEARAAEKLRNACGHRVSGSQGFMSPSRGPSMSPRARSARTRWRCSSACGTVSRSPNRPRIVPMALPRHHRAWDNHARQIPTCHQSRCSKMGFRLSVGTFLNLPI